MEALKLFSLEAKSKFSWIERGSHANFKDKAHRCSRFHIKLFMLHMAFKWTYYWEKSLNWLVEAHPEFSTLFLHFCSIFDEDFNSEAETKTNFYFKLFFRLVSLPYNSVWGENQPKCKGNNYQPDLFAIKFGKVMKSNYEYVHFYV